MKKEKSKAHMLEGLAKDWDRLEDTRRQQKQHRMSIVAWNRKDISFQPASTKAIPTLHWSLIAVWYQAINTTKRQCIQRNKISLISKIERIDIIYTEAISLLAECHDVKLWRVKDWQKNGQEPHGVSPNKRMSNYLRHIVAVFKPILNMYEAQPSSSIKKKVKPREPWIAWHPQNPSASWWESPFTIGWN